MVPRYSILAHQRDKARALQRLVLSVAVFGTAQLSGGERLTLDLHTSEFFQIKNVFQLLFVLINTFELSCKSWSSCGENETSV